MSKDLGKLISELPICDDGKDKVKELVRAMGHEVEEEVKEIPREYGQVFVSAFNDPALYTPQGYVWLGSQGVSMHNHTSFTYKARSLQEYYDKKRKGDL